MGMLCEKNVFRFPPIQQRENTRTMEKYYRASGKKSKSKSIRRKEKYAGTSDCDNGAGDRTPSSDITGAVTDRETGSIPAGWVSRITYIMYSIRESMVAGLYYIIINIRMYAYGRNQFEFNLFGVKKKKPRKIENGTMRVAQEYDDNLCAPVRGRVARALVQKNRECPP